MLNPSLNRYASRTTAHKACRRCVCCFRFAALSPARADVQEIYWHDFDASGAVFLQRDDYHDGLKSTTGRMSTAAAVALQLQALTRTSRRIRSELAA